MDDWGMGIRMTRRSRGRWYGAGGVLGIAGGATHSLVMQQGGEVTVVGRGEVNQPFDEEGNELDEPVMEVDDLLGLGTDVDEVLEPTVVPGLRVGRHQSVHSREGGGTPT